MLNCRLTTISLIFTASVMLSIFGCASKDVARPTTASASASKVGPGMNDKGEVVDSSQVQAGYGQQVQGLDGWEGEITGKSSPDSPFAKLKIGMSIQQVTDLIGQPSDQGAYITGKAWIPFYYGSDKYRYEFVYKGAGRLIFAGRATFSYGVSGNLTWIINNSHEGANR